MIAFWLAIGFAALACITASIALVQQYRDSQKRLYKINYNVDGEPKEETFTGMDAWTNADNRMRELIGCGIQVSIRKEAVDV